MDLHGGYTAEASSHDRLCCSPGPGCSSLSGVVERGLGHKHVQGDGRLPGSGRFIITLVFIILHNARMH